MNDAQQVYVINSYVAPLCFCAIAFLGYFSFFTQFDQTVVKYVICLISGILFLCCLVLLLHFQFQFCAPYLIVHLFIIASLVLLFDPLELIGRKDDSRFINKQYNSNPFDVS